MYAILVFKPRNKTSIAPKVQHYRFVLGKSPYRNYFLLTTFFQNSHLHRSTAGSLEMAMISVAIVSLLREQQPSVSKLQKM